MIRESGKRKLRLQCQCGCGEYFESFTTYNRKYKNNTHKMRAQRDRAKQRGTKPAKRNPAPVSASLGRRAVAAGRSPLKPVEIDMTRINRMAGPLGYFWIAVYCR